MDNLISRQAAIDALGDAHFKNYGNAIMVIQTLPSAEPVRHGKWELAKDGWYCSACELYPPFDCDPEEKGIPYCPYCGAKMYETQKKPCGDCQQFDCYGCEYAERKEE